MTSTPVAPRVSLKDVPPIGVVSVRSRVGTSDLRGLMETAERKVHGSPAGSPIVIYYDRIFDPHATDVEVAIPVSIGSEETLLPVKVAALTQHGSCPLSNEACAALMGWASRHGFRPSGPIREVYLIGPESGSDPAQYVTEVELPVRRQRLDER